ncbi:MAG: hypothetical protein K2M83_05420 [Muribaculaceae bacterium]|nr:hypothetical protein [Muribaculaceae bacterium]MDE6193403.1 hypothetical protein [Muribaculaceae bacterium]
MNVFKKISVAASVIAVATLSSCSDKGYWDEAPLDAGLSFQCSSYNETLSPGANEIVIPLQRSVNAVEETVDITFTPDANCPSDIIVPSQVTFAAGSNSTDIVIKIENATPPYSYTGKLQFSGDTSYSGISALTLNCPVSYTWFSLGTGGFIDAWVMDNAEDMFQVEILKAEGFERYRVMNPYKEYYTTIGPASWEDWIASTGPSYVEFWENADGKLSFNSYSTGLNYEGVDGQAIGAYSWTAFGGSSDYTGEYDMWYEPGYAVLSPVYYINGVGGFGQQQFAVQIELPK